MTHKDYAKLTAAGIALLFAVSLTSSCTTYASLQVGKTYRTTRNGTHRAGEFRVDSVYADGRYGMVDLVTGEWSIGVLKNGGGMKEVK